jgi:hypothetical protein
MYLPMLGGQALGWRGKGNGSNGCNTAGNRMLDHLEPHCLHSPKTSSRLQARRMRSTSLSRDITLRLSSMLLSGTCGSRPPPV